jgi:flagellar biosynthesis chaperone FliJ
MLAVGVALLSSCNKTPQLAAGADTGLALARSSSAKDSLILVKDSLLADKEKQLSAQSQLIGDAATSARLVAEIDRDLSKVRGLRVKKDTAQTESAMENASQELATVQKKVNTLIARLNGSESRIRRMRQDSTAHAGFDATQLAQLREYERSIGDLRSNVEQQKKELAQLYQRVDSMGRVTVALVARNDSVVARNNAMQAHEDSMFVAIGTKDELMTKGLIKREGGTALLFGRGKTLVPARSFDPAAFQVVSKMKDLTITLPRNDKDYQVVSRQSLEFTNLAAAKNAKVRGSITITDPQRFWAPSRYLILVQR